ncbi:MAG: hypothetical protein OEW77_04640 [Gemmatimonadota bacterium]|nr:hypothetical protein [Gemmatimonadota bacterium]
MPERLLDCDEVDARDVAAGYLARRLTADTAAAYEEHFIGCGRCWPALQRAMETRAAFGILGTGVNRRAWGLAAAAVLVVAAGAGLWSLREPAATIVAMRGGTDALEVHASAELGALTASWSPVVGAERYLVRLHGAAGDALVERETSDTVITVAVDSLDPALRTGAMFWQVQAIDRLRQPLRRSPLTAASPLSPP